MKIVVAMDSFKGTLSAADACKITTKAIKSVLPSATIIEKPLADGGEGTIETILSTCRGRYITHKVMGPLSDMQVDADFGWLEKERIAVVEMAKASGMTLLSEEELNPLLTTTFGTGQLIKAAMEMKPKKLLLAVGGSATVDGGVGAAMALGWKFLDSNGNSVGLGGSYLKEITRIIKPEELDICDIDVLCDVTNPLIGPNGAAYVYAPQKGADSLAVELLENSMRNLCEVVKKDLSTDINIPGAGAAGGLAAGAHAFMAAKLVSGIDEVMELIELPKSVQQCDCVITGEGCFDSQSLDGKVISGITKVAGRFEKKVYVIAGKVNLGKDRYYEHGIEEAVAISDGVDTDYTMQNAEILLEKSAIELARTHLAS